MIGLTTTNMGYRFSYVIRDDESDNIIISGSTYVGTVDINGGCESVELELSSGLRAFRKISKALEEKKEMAC